MNSNQVAFTMLISAKMIGIAEKLSHQEANQQKARTIYLNTLAILAVDFYCQCMEIETELEKSYGLDAVVPSLINTASLFIKNKGLLECRPIIRGEEFCEIPPEVLSERIGYIVLEIDESNREARILGFAESVKNDKLPLSRLKSLQDFLIYLQKLEVIKTPTVDIVGKINNNLVKLSRWFEGLLDSGWQPELAVAKKIKDVKSTEKEEVGGAKIIHLLHLAEPVLLILQQTKLSQQEIEIILRLYPVGESIFLLDGIKMALFDEEDKAIPQLEKQSKASNWLQLRFRGNIGDKFNLKISLGEDSITEKFII